MNYQSIHILKTRTRYFNQNHLIQILNTYNIGYTSIGQSIENKPIIKVSQGNGKTKVILWSQMHGNEVTGTLSLLECIRYFEANQEKIKDLTLSYILILNPDGAEHYTRENALGIDPNRDAKAQSTPEIKALFKYIKDIQPHYLFNLHDQRNIFNVENTSNPATLAFLAPSQDKMKTITPNRLVAMEVINRCYNYLQMLIKENISRFTDEHYPLATGDNLQALGIPTILIESGHYPNDDLRLKTRMHHTLTLINILPQLTDIKVNNETKLKYNLIPKNDQKLRDLIIYSVNLGTEISPVLTDISFIKEFKLINNSLETSYKVSEIGDCSLLYACNSFNYKGEVWNLNKPTLGSLYTIKAIDNKFISSI